jgi:hypothetical protein
MSCPAGSRGRSRLLRRNFLSLSLQAHDFPGSPGCRLRVTPSGGDGGRPTRVRVGAGTAWEFLADGPDRFARSPRLTEALKRGWHGEQPGWRGNAAQCFPGLCLQSGLLPAKLCQTRSCRSHGCWSSDAAAPRACISTAPPARSPSFSSRHGPARRARSPRPPGRCRPPRMLLPARHSAARCRADDPTGPHASSTRWPRSGQPPLEKLVLTRRVEVELAAMPALARMLEWLAARFPTPPCLRCGARESASSAPRRSGCWDWIMAWWSPTRWPARRRARPARRRTSCSAALLGDPKELAEHAVVVREILSALEPLCTALVASHSPSLLRLPNVQHLASHVHGRVRPDVGVFELLERHASHARGRRRPARRGTRLAAPPRRKRSRLVHRRRRLAGRRRRRYLGRAALRGPARPDGEPVMPAPASWPARTRSRNCARRAGSSRPCSRRSPLTDYAGAGDAGEASLTGVPSRCSTAWRRRAGLGRWSCRPARARRRWRWPRRAAAFRLHVVADERSAAFFRARPRARRPPPA